MRRRLRDLLRVFLPLLPLCLCNACGSRGESAAAAATADVDVAKILNNGPPIVALAPVEAAQVGTAFDYQPVTQDPESDTLRFTSVNLPTWATLDPASGHISGTPGPDDAGVYESISITVADATHQAVTAPFSITVNSAPDAPDSMDTQEVGNGVASLQWEIPPSKVSGEPLDDLVGFRILYGRSSSDLDHSVMIQDPATTSYQVSGLTSGLWYFAVVAVNANGLEGPPTTLANKSI